MPDHSTIWRFRQELARHDSASALFHEINCQLDARGLIIRQGTLIDAVRGSEAPLGLRPALTVEAAVKPPSMDEGTVSERVRHVRTARWHGRVGTGLIRDNLMTGADLHDSQAGPAPVQGDEKTVLGDKAHEDSRQVTRWTEARPAPPSAGRRRRPMS